MPGLRGGNGSGRGAGGSSFASIAFSGSSRGASGNRSSSSVLRSRRTSARKLARKLLVIGQVERHNPVDMGATRCYRIVSRRAALVILLSLVGCAPARLAPGQAPHDHPSWRERDDSDMHGGGDGGGGGM